ncbi:uncharacterized protein LOC110689870 [Chenopodium quinoa]|uniref:uncharacterized protein LOC110689870 n=1 Tax=Chenopodium quinoa TaxID=63459 RepID=UPI000B7977AC|nr:uncharacterized protein LOC110689870 [Chenopodium quinoa]
MEKNPASATLSENGKTREERDQLDQSNKKPKRKITQFIFNHNDKEDEIMAETKQSHMNIDAEVVGQSVRNAGSCRGSNSQQPSHSLVNIEDDEEDDISDDEAIPEEILNDDRCLIIKLTKEEKKRLRQPWKTSLIIKMFSAKLGYIGLMCRLKKKWNDRGELSLTDIGCNYYIARFTNQVDYSYVLTQGPWLLDDNYLTIRKWIPNLVSDESPIKVLTAKVRIPNLPIEYFDINFLNKIGSKIGKVLRMDKNTAQAERGQFTRLSVDINLSKPLLSNSGSREEFGGIRMVCFKCGKLGHVENDCKSQESIDSDNNVRMEENPLFHQAAKP